MVTLLLIAGLTTTPDAYRTQAAGAPLTAPQAVADSPDELYRHRDDLPSARRAAELWQARAATDYEAAWKLARVCYWLGTHVPQAQRTAELERGIAAGQGAAKLSPKRPEAHFWIAANMGEIAQSSKMYAGRNKGKIKDELEKVIAIQKGWQGGSAEAALGRWYDKVPSNWGAGLLGLGGGDPRKAEECFKLALAYDVHNKPAMSFYADFLIGENRKPDARRILLQLLADPIDPDWGPEEKEFQRTATERLNKLGT